MIIRSVVIACSMVPLNLLQIMIKETNFLELLSGLSCFFHEGNQITHLMLDGSKSVALCGITCKLSKTDNKIYQVA